MPRMDLVFGLAPGARPSPPTVSEAIFAAVSVSVLALDQRRFADMGRPR